VNQVGTREITGANGATQVRLWPCEVTDGRRLIGPLGVYRTRN